MHQHRGRRVVLALAVVGALLGPAFSAGAQTAADNTKVDKRDRAKDAATADRRRTAGIASSPATSGAPSWTTRASLRTRTT